MSKYGLLAALAAIFLSVPGSVSASTALLKEVGVDTARANQAKTKPFTLVSGNKRYTASAGQASLWFKTRTADGQTLLQLRPGAIYDYLNVHVSPFANELGENSRFIRVDGKVRLVEGGRKGKIVDGVKTSLAIRDALVAGKDSATLYMKEHRPTLFSASDFEGLKFPDLLAKGESNFAGSPRNRIHNINVGMKKFDGLVLQPGEQFSFNQYLGNVDAAEGYLPELVIKDNVTTPEFGGGLCQVSTTAFRAAMQAGLKIDQRRNHAYPVAYYGYPPGYDATIYPPNPDLKFTNDTGSPIYLRTSIVGTKAAFEVWGKSDGRKVKINGPFVTEKLPKGGLKAAVAQIVTKNGKSIREENFVSVYQSPDKFPTIRKANGE
ncbi:MAG: VanW family protein [Patescibacteria group bacterium]